MRRESHAGFGERPGETEPEKPDHRAPGRLTIHGELLALGIKVAASTVWQMLKDAGIDQAPQRSATSWSAFPCSQAEAIIAMDFFEVLTLTGARLCVLAAIEHATRRVRVLSATARPGAGWVAQAARNLVLDLEDAGIKIRYVTTGTASTRRRSMPSSPTPA